MALQPKSPLDILHWLMREKILLYAAIAFSIVLLIVFGLVIQTRKNIEHAKIDLALKQSRLLETESAIKRLKDIDGLLKERRGELRNLDILTLQPGTEATLLETFSDAVESLSLTVQNILPYDERLPTGREARALSVWNEEGFKKTMLDIKLRCKYQTLGLLFDRLEASTLAFTIEALDIQAAKGLAPNLDIRLVIGAYVRAA